MDDVNAFWPPPPETEMQRGGVRDVLPLQLSAEWGALRMDAPGLRLREDACTSQSAPLQRCGVRGHQTSATPGAQGSVLLQVEAGAGDARASGAHAELNGGASALEAAPQLRKGDVFFLPAHTALRLAAAPGGALTLWTSAVNARVFDERFRLPARAAPAEAAAAPAEAAGAPAVAVA